MHNSTTSVEQMQIFGARFSGTNWVEALARANFPAVRILRSDPDGGNDNFGWKHGDLGTERHIYVDGQAIKHDGRGNIVWPAKDVMVSEKDERYVGIDKDGDEYLKNNILPIDWEASSNTLLIVVNRNPINWLQSLHRKPHLALELYNLPFEEFIKRPWVTYASPHLETLYATEKKLPWIKKRAIVENNASVFEHRQSSLATFQAFPSKAQNLVFIPYETMLRKPEHTMADIAKHYELPMQSSFNNITSYKGRGQVEYSGSSYEKMDESVLQYVLDHIDWQTESKAGYSLRQSTKSFSPQQLADPASLVRVYGRIQCYRSGKLTTL